MKKARSQLRLADSKAIRVTAPETAVTLATRGSNLHLAGEIDREALYLFTSSLQASDLDAAWVDTLVEQRALPTLRRQEREQALLKEASAQLNRLRQWLDDRSTGHKEKSPVINREADQGTSNTR